MSKATIRKTVKRRPTRATKDQARRTPAKSKAKKIVRSAIAAGTQPVSKQDHIISLLRGQDGASLVEMQKASGWQAHSVRGFLSGTVKKKLALKLQSEQTDDGERRYRLAS